MTASEFDARLSDVLDETVPADPYLEAFDSLRQVAGSIQKWLDAPGAEVEVEPGFQGRIGQQLNIVLKIPDRSIGDTLFRAYVTPSGKISLDLYDDEPIPCANEEEMMDHVLGFMAAPEVRSRLKMYKKIVK